MDKNKKMISLLMALTLSLGLTSGCSKSEDGELKEYLAHEHVISQVNRDGSLFGNKSETFQLEAPLGYKVVDYDYDFSDGLLEFHDYVYENVVPVETTNGDKIGTPVDKNYKVEQREDGIYNPGEHILVSIDKSLNLLLGKEKLFDLEAPYGYEVMDYDYDKTSSLEFENIVYRNVLPVKVSDVNTFGVPLDNEIKENRNFYDSEEHTIVDLQRNITFWIGKNDQFALEAPSGYVITDYDYDKTDMSEFQTITYKNIVPVSKEVNNFGTPLETQEARMDGYYKPGEHVIVKINRSINFFLGKNGTKELIAPEGYEVLDYDYEYGEDFQFETYVYTNKENVYAENKDDFGKVLSK